MKMKKGIIITGLAVSALYALFPCVAGALKLGEQQGPAIYPQPYHMLMFRIGYSYAGHGKPRVSRDIMFYHRPPFYGIRPSLISQSEANAFLSFQETNQPPEVYARLESRYEELKQRDVEPSSRPVPK